MKRILKTAPLLGLATLVLIGLATGAHGSTLYVTDDQNDFGTLDLSTGTFNVIGTIMDNANYDPMFNPNGDPVGGLSFGPSGTLYGLTLDSTSNNPFPPPTGSDLVTINPANAATTDLGNVGVSVDTALALPDGTLLANDVNNDNTYQITTGPGPAVIFTANSGAPLGGGLTFGPGTDLYSEAFEFPTTEADGSHGAGEDQLDRLDPVTLQATFVGEIEDAAKTHYNVAASAYDGTTLYGLTAPYDFGGGFSGGGNDIITINPVTGLATPIGTYTLPAGGSFIEAATFALPATAAVPEPSPVAPFAIAGLGLLGLTMRARNRKA